MPDSSSTDASGNKYTDNSNVQTGTFNFNNSVSDAFNKSNAVFIVWFLAIYFVLYFLIGLFTKPSNSETAASQAGSKIGSIVDIVLLLLLILFIGSMAFSGTSAQNQQHLEDFGTSFTKYLEDPYSLASLGLFMFFFYLAIYIVGISMGETSKPISIWLVENLVILLFIILLICNFFKYVLNTDLVKQIADKIADWWKDGSSTTTNTDVSGNKNAVVSNKVRGEEVFNIANNMYTYDDAQAICKSYGARLATYDDIEAAYNDGGEWCNYGWSANQMAFFPTQKSTWNTLQQTKNHKNDCGRPGVNGGYFANPNIKFGVNCYGKKPTPSETELKLMKANAQYRYPKTPEELAIDDKVKYWKDHSSSLLNLNSFNSNKWSERN
jgi:hypothetical protein